MNQPRNKFIDRFRTQIIKPTQIHSQQKTQRFVKSHVSSQLRFSQGERSISRMQTQDIIVDRLQKHIKYLQRKLKDVELDNERLKCALDAYERKLMEKDMERQHLVHEVTQLQEEVSAVMEENERMKSDRDNLLLKMKMDKLSGEVNEKREAYTRIELKHLHKRGRFSQSFLPKPFSSPSKALDRKGKAILNNAESTMIKRSGVSGNAKWKEKQEEAKINVQGCQICQCQCAKSQ